MEFEDIGRVWREEGTGALRRTRTEDLSVVLERVGRCGIARRRRFARLTWVVAVPLVLVFAYMAWNAPHLVAAAGAALMGACAAWVAVRYRAIGRTTDATLPVRLALQSELAHLNALGRLRRNAPWFRTLYRIGYVAFVVGVIALEEGGPRVPTRAVGLYLSIPLIVEGLIYVARGKRPQARGTLKEELSSWLDSLDELDTRETGDPSGGRPNVGR